MKIEGLDVKLAQSADLEWCVQQDRYLDPRIVERKLREGDLVVAHADWFEEPDGVRAGYLRLEYLWSRIPYIGLVHVLPPFRRQGIGAALIRFLTEYLYDGGYRLLMSSSQANEPDPQRWHRAMGFKGCGYIDGINEDGSRETFFRLDL